MNYSDWQPGSVAFYADGQLLEIMSDMPYVPQAAGKVVLSHWSNGNKDWSEGPPTEDTKITVSYVQAYFNSSNPSRISDHAKRCPNPNAPNAICQIPDLTGPPEVGKVNFFSQASNGNMTNNQTVYAKDGDKSFAPSRRAGIVTAVLVAGLVALVV